MNMLSLSLERAVTAEKAAALRANDPDALQPLVPADVRTELAARLPVRVRLERRHGSDVAVFEVCVESLDVTR